MKSLHMPQQREEESRASRWLKENTQMILETTIENRNETGSNKPFHFQGCMPVYFHICSNF